jgi:glucose/arabinose dehydrogenase
MIGSGWQQRVCRGVLVGVLGAVGAACVPVASGPPVPAIPPPSAAVFRVPQVVPRPAGFLPAAPPGFRVELYTAAVESPRSLLVLPGGDVLVAEGRTERMGAMPEAVVQALTAQGVFGPSPDRILRLRGPAGRVTVTTAATGLRQPHGMAVLGPWLYVGNTDGVVRFPFDAATGGLGARAEPVLALPAGEPNNHWTRNLLPMPAGDRLFVAVGAATNVNEDG